MAEKGVDNTVKPLEINQGCLMKTKKTRFSGGKPQSHLPLGQYATCYTALH